MKADGEASASVLFTLSIWVSPSFSSLVGIVLSSLSDGNFSSLGDFLGVVYYAISSYAFSSAEWSALIVESRLFGVTRLFTCSKG